MGLYLRKSVRVGPFRFNLSGSGIGVSCGIPGLRFGTGPRGNYISAGAGGVYYRSALPANRVQHPRITPSPPTSPQRPLYDSTLTSFQTIDAGASIDLRDVSSKALIDELNRKRERLRLLPWIVVAGVATCAALYAAGFGPLEIVLTAVAFAPLIFAAWLRDVIKKTSVLMYDLDSETLLSYAELTAAFDRAAGSERIWHLRSAASVLDRKYHAGASTVIDTDQSRFAKTAPPKVKTNLEPLQIAMPQRTLYFFPDRVLLLDAAGFGAINYRDLSLDIRRSTFITGDTYAPRDANIVEYTWRYVNRRGGPDHRFANNPQLPVIETRDLSFQTHSGFNATLKFSNAGAADSFHTSLVAFGGKLHTNSTTVAAIAEHVDPKIESPVETASSRDTASSILVLLSLLGLGLLIGLHYATGHNEAHPPIAYVSPTPSISVAPAIFAQSTPTVRSFPNPASTPVRVNRIEAKPSAIPDDKFVTVIRPTMIITAKGRYTIAKGTRLPLKKITRDTVIVHYYDGGDYEISRSDTDHRDPPRSTSVLPK
jgi:hypothetical protein